MKIPRSLLRLGSSFEIYDFPNPERNAERFNIKNKAVRENFIKSLYYLMEEIKDDILVKFNGKLAEFKTKYENLDRNDFNKQFLDLINREEYIWIRNLFFWAIEMNYIDNFFEKPDLIDRKNIDKILSMKNNESKNFYYNEYIITTIYSIINKTLFIRILEDSQHKRGYKFIKGEKDGRYLSNGIIHEKFLKGKLKEYISTIFEFKKSDLKHYHFLLKHDIYDWIISEIEEYTLVHFLRTFNEIYLRELDQDILGDIYEHYLQEDRNERKGKSYRRMLGQYYTPRPIVRLMWLLVRDCLKQNKNIDIYKKGQKLLDVLDPFMGSGTFLNEAVLQMKASDSGKSIKKGEVFHFFKDRSQDRQIEKSITGFEINPLSCSIADINIYFRLIKSFSSDSLEQVPIKELNLLRTNSFDLDYKQSETMNLIQLSLLAEEIKSSFSESKKIREAKMKKYDIIISNPPYGIISPTKFMKEELIPFAFSENNFDERGNEISFIWRNKNIKGKIPKIEKNRGKLRDMYAFAFGVADKLVKDSGIICYITSNTYLTLPTYKWMRKYWLENYTIEYIINFNRIMEKKNSMFSPEAAVATAIIVMTKKKPSTGHKIKYLDLSSLTSIKEKYDSFNEIEWKEPAKDKNDIIAFKTKKPSELDFSQIDQSVFLSNPDYELIERDPIIREIEKDTEYLLTFGEFQLGIITSNDEVFVNDNKQRLLENIRNYVIKNGIIYQPEEVFIRPYIRHKNIVPYALKDITYTYYDKELETLVHKKAKEINKPSPMRLRDEEKMNRKFKLLI